MTRGPSVALFLDGEVGARLLAWLIDQQADLRLAVTHPDGRRSEQERIDGLLAAAGIPAVAYRPRDVPGFLDEVATRSASCEVLLSAWFGYILPPQVIALGTQAAFNTHPSYLPYNRGKHPNVWSIVEGTPAGGSVHVLEAGIDSGDVLVRREVAVRPDDTGESLYRRCVAATEAAFREAWGRIAARTYTGTPQAELGPGSYHNASELKTLDTIDLDEMVRAGDLLDRLRARTFPPHPGARFVADGKTWQVRVAIEPVEDEQPAAVAADDAPAYHGTTPVNDPALIEAMAQHPSTASLGVDFMRKVNAFNYSYNFTWLGRPIIQYPQDLVALQEVIWAVQPDVIVETGIAHGGSLIFSASMLELLGGDREVVGVDIDIRAHNRVAIEAHPMFKRITLIEGSSTSAEVLEQVRARTAGRERVLVVLDSNHSHKHVRKELDLYSPLVTRDSYLIVFDTIIEHLYDGPAPDRPWGKGDNPLTAVHAFLETTDRFVLDDGIEKKLLITVGPGGYLRCAVPDANFPDPPYQRIARIGGPGPKSHPASDHKIVYGYRRFAKVFVQAGFSVDLLEYCDEQGRFHYHQWSPDQGPVYRSLLQDHRNQAGQLVFVSLIVDARKPD